MTVGTPVATSDLENGQMQIDINYLKTCDDASGSTKDSSGENRCECDQVAGDNSSTLSDAASVNTQLQFKKGFAGGLRRDLQRRAPYYKSDWADAFINGNFQQCMSSICFLFFACLAPAIAFGTIYETQTDGQMGVVECILASGFAGVVYSVLSGQPLCILGGTGPNLAYTVAFYQICKSMDLDFLTARVWQGLWCSLITIIFALTGASAWMSHVTRYVEEIFSALISLIFIVEAFKSVIDTYYKRDEAAAFLTTLLCLSTYILAIKLKALKVSKVLTPMLRFTISNFAVTIAILIVSSVAQIWDHVNIEWLSVPSELVPTMKLGTSASSRPWLINPMGGQGLNPDGIKRDLPTWAIFFTMIPGLGMALLNYLDQNLTTKLINRPASGLKKPGAYHLDMLVLGAIIYPVVSIFGLPFPCAATVRSLAHLISLTTYEDRPIPGGGMHKVASKVVEQRVTHLSIHILMLVSLLLSNCLKYVPKGVLFGVFLFMGMTSITGNQLFERIFLWSRFDPATYPRLPYVTRITTRRLHLFTFIQFVCLAILYGLKSVKQTAMVFPFFIALLVFVRKGLGWVFTQKELRVLDAEEELAPEPELQPERQILPVNAETATISIEQPEESETEKVLELQPEREVSPGSADVAFTLTEQSDEKGVVHV
mmetsp:Transcript_88056/g.139109  ORF Transcript_88056/g.139109 Transcript_88056/m.139109 type:complete len:656 (-) Transcript_88056:239-2206(-)|eukprot:CAMPEP_0169098854 /NCGR_PEP_ID=MMETSP1015-20121227/20258_1 /TAXON_ID=342587 /ORGANISM="Karlodinium micrum, Strain CCMP2283" /LENGTH=655 /DNA_ID=CAMNT_0009159721 /DNA_START=64 /DNA_END=2031 /DNA_ORIENTATION=+